MTLHAREPDVEQPARPAVTPHGFSAVPPYAAAILRLQAQAGNAATTRLLARQSDDSPDPYAGLPVAELRKLARADPEAAWALRARYQNMADAELRNAARRDSVAKTVLEERRSAASQWTPRPDAKGSGYEIPSQWEGHRVPHEATGVSRDAKGNVVWRGAEKSGGATPEQKALDFPERMNVTHTEAKLVTKAHLPRGGTFRITGQYPPCTACQQAMKAAAARSGCTIEYWWPGADGKGFVARPPVASRLRTAFRIRLPTKALRTVLKPKVRAGLRSGIASVVGMFALHAFLTWYMNRRWDEQTEEFEEELAKRLADRLPVGLALAVRHPASQVYANVIYHFGMRVVTNPESAVNQVPFLTLRQVYYDTEPVAAFGPLASEDASVELRRWKEGSTAIWEYEDDWREYGISIPLWQLLAAAPESEELKSFRSEHAAALAQHRVRHPEQRPPSRVTSVPHEDPVRR
jgi:Pput_2613-like deaminase